MCDQKASNFPSGDDDTLRGHLEFETETVLGLNTPSIHIIVHDESLPVRRSACSESAITGGPLLTVHLQNRAKDMPAEIGCPTRPGRRRIVFGAECLAARLEAAITGRHRKPQKMEVLNSIPQSRHLSGVPNAYLCRLGSRFI